MKISVIDPNTLNLDPDPEFQPILEPGSRFTLSTTAETSSTATTSTTTVSKALEATAIRATSVTDCVQSNTFPTDAEEIQQKLFVLIRINLKKRTDAIKFCNAFAVNV